MEVSLLEYAGSHYSKHPVEVSKTIFKNNNQKKKCIEWILQTGTTSYTSSQYCCSVSSAHLIFSHILIDKGDPFMEIKSGLLAQKIFPYPRN